MSRTQISDDTKYLFRRDKVWWVKLAVPRPLRDVLGRQVRVGGGQQILPVEALFGVEGRRGHAGDTLTAEAEALFVQVDFDRYRDGDR